jgi:hypothetical protein
MHSAREGSGQQAKAGIKPASMTLYADKLRKQSLNKSGETVRIKNRFPFYILPGFLPFH